MIQSNIRFLLYITLQLVGRTRSRYAAFACKFVMRRTINESALPWLKVIALHVRLTTGRNANTPY